MELLCFLVDFFMSFTLFKACFDKETNIADISPARIGNIVRTRGLNNIWSSSICLTNMDFPGMCEYLTFTGACVGTLRTLESLRMLFPEMSLEIVPRVGFIFALSALETIRAGGSVNVYKLSSGWIKAGIFPDLIVLFLNNFLCRFNSLQTGVRSEVFGKLVSLGVEIATAHTGEHVVEVAGELVALQRLHRQSFMLTVLTRE